MAVEPRRGCGYRKVGGLYLVSGNLGAPCCKMPILLHVCPTCNGGIKQSRGWQWIDPRPWIAGDCLATPAEPFNTILNAFSGGPLCVLNPANADRLGERVGLIWIGTQFYPNPNSFQVEAAELGVSRRIHTIPRGFEVGKTWVFLAHPKVKENPPTKPGDDVTWTPGVFRIFKPERIEKIITESQSQDKDEMAKLAKAKITPVIVPDDDKDHQGSVYDDDDANGVGQTELVLEGGEDHRA